MKFFKMNMMYLVLVLVVMVVGFVGCVRNCSIDIFFEFIGSCEFYNLNLKFFECIEYYGIDWM